jgi:hypothetical protein
MKIKRQVPKDDPVLLADYSRLMEWLGWPPVVEGSDGRYYFRPSDLSLWLIEDAPMGGGVSLQDLAIAHQRGRFPLREWAGFYVSIGYRLDGFLEIFADRIWSKED